MRSSFSVLFFFFTVWSMYYIYALTYMDNPRHFPFSLVSCILHISVFISFAFFNLLQMMNWGKKLKIGRFRRWDGCIWLWFVGFFWYWFIFMLEFSRSRRTLVSRQRTSSWNVNLPPRVCVILLYCLVEVLKGFDSPWWECH